MRGIKPVFLFNLRQLTRVKSYRRITLIMALIFFLIPAVLLPLTQSSSNDTVIEVNETDSGDFEDSEAADETAEALTPTFIAYVADENVEPDWCALLSTGLSGYTEAEWKSFADLDQAEEACSGKASLILTMTSYDDAYSTCFNAILPEESLCSATDSDLFLNACLEQYQEVLLQNLTPEQKEALAAAGTEEQMAETAGADENGQAAETANAGADGQAAETADAGADGQAAETANAGADDQSTEETLQDTENEDESFASLLLSLLLPYINIMLVYFLVLYYGQYAANSVIQEKTSKLMDTMLVSVKPRALIMGKVTATWAASSIQFLIWVFSLAAGLLAGTFVSIQMNPGRDSVPLMLLQTLGAGLGSFGALRIVLAVIMIMAGYFMYCALSSIGGAIAGKPEELSATNTLFSTVMIVSFMGALYSGFMNDTLGKGIAWVDLVPSVSVLITPARLILGTIPLYGGFLSLGITLAAAVLLMLLAGRIYSMMSMYKGNLPKPKQLLDMLRRKE